MTELCPDCGTPSTRCCPHTCRTFEVLDKLKRGSEDLAIENHDLLVKVDALERKLEEKQQEIYALKAELHDFQQDAIDLSHL